ncbi:MAG: LytR C-terminal domain-containing protein [Bacteroidetes bacterium]|nr:LytR C-terminal domain-containing protein [Bacteroidota bacterium]MBU1680973.1 LytR C-terminal domain-containing protein [Bacteroidota bacterium]MBU2506109.1 LytR C-terminal domain-containing protein [Bacteroidota bacterium]
MSVQSGKNRNSSSSRNKALANIFLNAIIFLLAALIIYMSYSLFLKFTSKEKIVSEADSDEVASEIIQLQVLNGCGVSGIADRFTDYLRANKFDVVNSGNYSSFTIEETLVIDRIGNLANANKVAQSLGVNKKNVIRQLNKEYFLDVSVIIGKDYYKLEPLK